MVNKYLMMPHVSFGAIKQTFELQTVGIPVGDHVANLTNYSGENEHANQIAHDREHIPVEENIVVEQKNKNSKAFQKVK